MTTSELLSESVESARHRERAALEDFEPQAGAGIVLYGAGRLGRKAAAALRKAGITPLAFADSAPELNGTVIEGIRVCSPATATQRWRGDALFAVATFRPDQGGVAARLRELAAFGCRRTTTFLPLAWKFPGILPHFGADLPSKLLRKAGDLLRIASLWCDNTSTDNYRRELAWRLRADFEGAPVPTPDQYFPRDILRPAPSESFIDGGAFDGDTLRQAPWPLARVLAVEPDPANAARLRAMSFPGIRVHEVLLGREPDLARFNGTGTMASRREESGALEVPVTTIDLMAAGERPTFIKLDVEGDELEALKGARETLQRCRPVVAVCLYHRPEDLWTIPLFLHSELPEHRLYLRVHAHDGFELVAYAVPPERCLPAQ
jgi:FkbM family methyltransferase